MIQEFLDLDDLHLLAKISKIGILAIFWPFIGTKTSSNHFYLVGEVLNLVGHM